MKFVYRVKGMKCASCAAKIKEVLKNFAQSIEVTLDPPQAVLEGAHGFDLEKINAAIKKTGDYELIPLETASLSDNPNPRRNWIHTYTPLFIIIGMISLVSFAGATSIHQWMLHFMAGFFLVFGSFKLFDLRGFRDAYATYDLLAKFWPRYGLIYPFPRIKSHKILARSFKTVLNLALTNLIRFRKTYLRSCKIL